MNHSQTGHYKRDNKEFFYNKNIADDYSTPDWLLNELVRLFKISVDIAGDSHNSKFKGSPLFDKGFDALESNWSEFPGVKFCFPPFSKPFFGMFLNKAHEEWKMGESSIVMAPLKTISVDYFQRVRSPRIHVIYPRVFYTYNNREVSTPDSVCILEYNAEIENFTVPEIKFIDLRSSVPSFQRR